MWVVELLLECLIIFIASPNLSIQVVGGTLSLFGNCLEEALEAIAFFDLLFEVVVSVHANSVLLLGDQIGKFLHLGFHPLQLGDVILHVVLGGLVILVKWLQSLRVGVGGDGVGDGEVRLDVHDFHGS